MEERLLNILKHYDLSPSSFADKIGVQRSSISHLLSGRNKPSFDFLSRMMSVFNDLNIEWFISGKGIMIKKPVSAPINLSLFDNSNFEDESPKQKEAIEEKMVTDVISDGVTNVINEGELSKNRVSKIILFFNDRTWEEFLPPES